MWLICGHVARFSQLLPKSENFTAAQIFRDRENFLQIFFYTIVGSVKLPSSALERAKMVNSIPHTLSWYRPAKFWKSRISISRSETDLESIFLGHFRSSSRREGVEADLIQSPDIKVSKEKSFGRIWDRKLKQGKEWKIWLRVCKTPMVTLFGWDL